MAAMRVNISAIFVSGGPMAAGRTPEGESIDLTSKWLRRYAHIVTSAVTGAVLSDG